MFSLIVCAFSLFELKHLLPSRLLKSSLREFLYFLVKFCAISFLYARIMSYLVQLSYALVNMVSWNLRTTQDAMNTEDWGYQHWICLKFKAVNLNHKSKSRKNCLWQRVHLLLSSVPTWMMWNCSVEEVMLQQTFSSEFISICWFNLDFWYFWGF